MYLVRFHQCVFLSMGDKDKVLFLLRCHCNIIKYCAKEFQLKALYILNNQI